MYSGDVRRPKDEPGKVEEILTKRYGDIKYRIITVGDINARHRTWDKI